MADILLITGLSGAGRSQAADDLEDLGWFVVDNMPTELIDKVVEIASAGSALSQLALVVGTPTQQRDVLDVLRRLRLTSHRVRMLFLDATNSELVSRYLGTVVPAARDGFSALNASSIGTGSVIHVAKEMVSDIPVHVIHVSTANANDVLSQPRHLIVVEPHAKASVIESFVALGDASNFTNSVTEVIVEDGATLTHLRIQLESSKATHIGTVEARQGRDSHFVSFSLISGSGLSRTNVYTVLNGEGCGTTLNGLYLLDGTQHGDTQTRVEHVAPRCFSRELYKGLLDGASHGVFNGKVYVHPEAQKTDGKQTNQTLLLSDKAKIDTKPQLEIFADDVKCTHGATVGRIDETALFYLKSRGVGATLARQLLMYAFAADVLESIEIEAVRDELERMTLARYTGAPVASATVDR